MCVVHNGGGQYVSQADIQAIKDMGFTGIKWWLQGWGPMGPNRDVGTGFQPTPTTMDETFFSAGNGAPAGNILDTVVDWCEQAGLYIIIGLGWTEWWGPPLWTKLSNTSPNGSALWTDPTTRNGFYFMMNWVAKRYATRSHVIFEGSNEITGIANNDADMPAWAAFNDGWLSAMEAGEGTNRHLKIIQMLLMPSWGYITTNLPFFNGTHSNVMMASHSYPIVDTWMSPDLENNYAKRWADAIHSQGLPWQDTEFSTAVNAGQTNPPPRAIGLQQAMDMFTKYNAAGWGYFCYTSKATDEGDWNIRNPANAVEILPILQPYLNPPQSWLHTNGTKIYNEANQEVVFNGTSTMTVFGYEIYGVYPTIYTPALMDEVRSHGMNFIRLDVAMGSALYGVPASQQTPTNLTFNPLFFQQLDALVNECAKIGMWVNINFACNALSPMAGWNGSGSVKGGGVGLPTWMFDGTWSYFTKTYRADTYGHSDATRDFFNTSDPVAENLRTAYKTWWKQVADHYKTSANVIFGLWNEPQVGPNPDSIWGNTTWDGKTPPTQQEGAVFYKTLCEQTVDAIRSVAPNNLIFVNVAYFWDHFTNLKVDRPNIVVEGHNYSGTTWTYYSDPHNSPPSYGRKFWELGWRYNQPYIMGEFGGIEEGNLESKASTIQTAQELNAVRASWSYLSFRPYGSIWNPSADTWATVLEPNLVPNIVYYGEEVSPIQHSILLSAGSNGTTTPAPNQYMINQNTNFQATAIPNTGYQVSYWSLDGVNVSTANSYTIQNITAPHTLAVVFKPIVTPPKRRVKVNPGRKKTNGMEIDGGGTTIPVAGEYEVDPNTTLRVTAVPDGTSQFDSWVLDGNIVPNNPNPLDIAVGDTDHEVTPYYADITPTLAGFPWWTIPIGMVIGGYYLIKRHGKKPRG